MLSLDSLSIVFSGAVSHQFHGHPTKILIVELPRRDVDLRTTNNDLGLKPWLQQTITQLQMKRAGLYNFACLERYFGLGLAVYRLAGAWRYCGRPLGTSSGCGSGSRSRKAGKLPPDPSSYIFRNLNTTTSSSSSSSSSHNSQISTFKPFCFQAFS
jgi:hypothetical protein